MRGAATVLVVLAGCEAASSDPGLDAVLQVRDAQYRAGRFPADEGGPAAVAVSTRHAGITIGRLDEQLRGALEPSARAAVIAIEGLDGAWLVPAGVPEIDTPGLASLDARFGVTEDLPPGPFTLLVAGADDHGRFGPAASAVVVADVEPPLVDRLVVSLVWEGPADLDLHVVEPGGGEGWSDKPNTMPIPEPGTPVDPEEWKRHGILDRDGNADCHRDGRPSERFVWQAALLGSVPPPTGEYVVRVDARSMCGAPSAAWYVAAARDGVLLGAARGVSTPDDVLQPHGAGAGVLALRFSL
ncbi:MAG: hypothetical protein AB7O24_15795 [Kofleriaceae bacterium]